MHWVFVAALRLSLVAASRGYSSLQGSGFSQPWPLLLWSMASRCMGLISCCTRAQQLQRVALRARGLSSRSVRLSGHVGSAVAVCGSQDTRGQQSQHAALRALGVSSRSVRLRALGVSSCSLRLSGHTGSAVAACGSQGTRGQQLQPAALRARGVSSRSVQLSGHSGSAVAATGLVAPWRVKCSWTQD